MTISSTNSKLNVIGVMLLVIIVLFMTEYSARMHNEEYIINRLDSEFERYDDARTQIIRSSVQRNELMESCFKGVPKKLRHQSNNPQ